MPNEPHRTGDVRYTTVKEYHNMWGNKRRKGTKEERGPKRGSDPILFIRYAKNVIS